MKSKNLCLTIILLLIIEIWTKNNLYIVNENKILSKSNQNSLRKISEINNYKPIRIYPDFTYLKSQSQNDSNLANIEIEIEKSLDISIKTLKKLLKVRPLTYPINKISSEDLNQWSFATYNINESLLTSGEGINSDLVILLKFIESGERNLLIDNEIASISNKFILDEGTKRPIVGVIYINTNIDVNKINLDIYLNYLFLHELTHILGFHYELFENYPGGINNTIKTEKEERLGKEKKFIITPKVVEFAKKYFNCEEIDGVELENQDDLKWSHWEARILLGEYMTSSPYTPEQAISEFTLSLLEDSGWYKVNYYTGGLMKFGKNKGCDFLKKDCVNKFFETNFKYEFCDFQDARQPRCSLGRQSRAYCTTYEKDEINLDKYKDYMRKFFGRMEADNCPVNDIEKEEENNIYYVGNCKYGSGKYGTHNNLGGGSLTNENFEDILGEKYGSNSFCILSSIDDEIFGSFKNSFRAACYPMSCSSKSLTIQIHDQYILCPRQGGKVEINGKYKGYLLCPDYNSICTGTEFCNDMFDCVEKESLAKKDIYNYDYEINYNESKIFKAEELVELGDDGICPKNCWQCEGQKKCIKCLDGYSFVSENKDISSVECIKNEDIDKEDYCYDQNGIYYKCGWELIKENIDNKIKEDIENENLDEIIQNYIEKIKKDEKIIMAYKNEDISITIYKEKGSKKIFETISSNNEKDIIKVLNENYSNDNNKIKVIVNNKRNYTIYIYDEEGNKINFQNDCPKCIEILEEKNKNKKFGEVINNIILKNNINISKSEDPIFNEICSNFTVSGIDVPISSRKEIFLEDKNTKISSLEKAKNTFEIFNCFKSGNYLLTNEGFYISLCTFCIQSICFILYLISSPKIALFPGIPIANPVDKKTKKNSDYKAEETGEKMNKKDENDAEEEKIENKIMNIGNIDEEIDDDEEEIDENKKDLNVSNYKKEEKKKIKLDTLQIKKLKITTNEEVKTLEEIDELNKNTPKTLNTNSKNDIKENPQINAKNIGRNNNRVKDNLDTENFSLQGSVNKKLNIKEKELEEFEEKIKNNEKILIHYKNKKNKIDQMKQEKENQPFPLDYLPMDKAIQLDKRSLGITYWCILSFKQSIINLLSFFDTFKITKSCIPIQMKLIRFLLMLILNIFINSMTLTQNYFKEKYEYFDKKYQIVESDNVKLKIFPLERLSYAMKHCFPEVIITFIICVIIQFIINFVFFGIRRELCILSIYEKKENINKEVQKIIKKTKKRYIIFAFINLFLMILFFVYLTNFSNAYSGGALDYIGAGIWTFIFLQIFPFISSLLIAFLRQHGMKNKNEKMYKLSQVLLA